MFILIRLKRCCWSVQGTMVWLECKCGSKGDAFISQGRKIRNPRRLHAPNKTDKVNYASCYLLQVAWTVATIGAFIKRGQESGYTKFTLRGNTPEEKIVILCKIDAHNRPSGYIMMRTR